MEFWTLISPIVLLGLLYNKLIGKRKEVIYTEDYVYLWVAINTKQLKLAKL